MSCIYKIIQHASVGPSNQRPESCPRFGRDATPSTIMQNHARVLTLGDGDFSFSLSLARRRKHKLVATSFESQASLQEVYPRITSTFREMQGLGVEFHFNVDATKHSEQFSAFDAVVFNFPCIPVEDGLDGQNGQMEANKTLIREFTQQVNVSITKSKKSRVYVTHKSKPPYDQWGVVDLIQEEGILFVHFL